MQYYNQMDCAFSWLQGHGAGGVLIDGDRM